MGEDEKSPQRKGSDGRRLLNASRSVDSSGRSRTVRDRYLDYLEKDVTNRLKSSIYYARFINLGLKERVNATLPWHYVAFEGRQQFSTFDQAFEHFDRRILLLGAPGSGKTTTLLDIALKLVSQAQQNPTAAIPLLFNLSKFDEVPEKKLLEHWDWLHKKEKKEGRQQRLFENWLIQMLSDMPVEGLNLEIARQWVERGQVALLLDGLDEVSDSYLKKLAVIMNETYFRDHPNQTAVICSRIIEYQPLQDDKETRLRLEGAVTLQLLSQEQINDYLVAAEATSLRDALVNDEVMYEMAQTPLTLEHDDSRVWR